MTTDDTRSGLPEEFPVQALLGYLNFSEGRPDPRFQTQLGDAFAHFADRNIPRPWEALAQALRSELDLLHRRGSAAFQDISQADAVLRLALAELLAAYRAHPTEVTSPKWATARVQRPASHFEPIRPDTGHDSCQSAHRLRDIT